MSQLYLQEVIVNVLGMANGPLTVAEIARTVAEQGLWLRPSDNQPPPSSQIHARVNNYPHLFTKENGYVRLNNIDEKEIRLFRLTWNTTGWQQPIKHKWRKANQGKSNIAFENQYGFGGEEWLFNPRYQVDGYQYGYIRGVQDLGPAVTHIDTAFLFTFNQESGERFLVGRINKLEVIKDNPVILRTAKKLYNSYLSEVEADLADAEADPSGLKSEDFLPNVRFQLTGEEFFDPMQPAPGLDGHKFKRFIPYIVDDDVRRIVEDALPDDSFVFSPGVAFASKDFERNYTVATSTVKRLHTDITKALETYLSPNFSQSRKNLSIERTRFGGNIADVVLKHGEDNITVLEVKTSNNARKNIREALGQLLDYACWHDYPKIEKLIVVAPTVLSTKEREYLNRIRETVGFPIGYWQYIPNSVKGTDSFKEYC